MTICRGTKGDEHPEIVFTRVGGCPLCLICKVYNMAQEYTRLLEKEISGERLLEIRFNKIGMG